MKICHRYKIPVVPFGGGTSLEGHTLTTSDHSVCIDMNNMKDVLSFHPLDLDIKVQAGLGYIELNEMLAKDKLWFPLGKWNDYECEPDYF